MSNRERGAVLMAVVVFLLLALTLVPLMVVMAQRESVWTAKIARSTRAFHLAESGVEKAYLALSQPAAWNAVQAGAPLPHFSFDKSFSDVPGGTYSVSITSGPGTKQATIISVGRDDLRRETRALRVVYEDASLDATMLYAGAGVQLGGNVSAEWGAILSAGPINTGGAAHPQFWSADKILPFDASPSPPNCDSPSCCQWHSYDARLPPPPAIDLTVYSSSADATNTHYASSASWTNVTDWGGKTFYINTDLSVGSPGIDIIGNVIVQRNMSTAAGNFGTGNHPMPVPRKAWKQYCNDWAAYLTFDPGAPASFPGLSSSYQSAPGLTYTSHKLAVQGVLYVGGSFSVGGGGGGSDIDGAMYVVGTSTMTSGSHVTLYFSADAAQLMPTSQIQLSRASWRETLASWPAGL